MAAQAIDIQNLTAAVTALNGAFGGPNWNNVTAAVNNLQVAVAAQNVQQAARGHGLVHPPTFNDGSQDPVSWLTEFNQAADANGWNAARKCVVVPAYLKRVVAIWYQIVFRSVHFRFHFGSFFGSNKTLSKNVFRLKNFTKKRFPV